MEIIPGHRPSFHHWDGVQWVSKTSFIRIFPPLVCVKVHGNGRAWWDQQGMPSTWTISCTAGPNGLHLIYEQAEGFRVPLAGMQDSQLSTVDDFTRVPPDPSKSWIRRIPPTILDHFPEIPAEWRGCHPSDERRTW